MFSATLSSLCLVIAVLCVFGAPPEYQDAPNEGGSYEGYRVLSVIPTNESHVEAVKKLNDNLQVDFWMLRPRAFEENVLSVSPKDLDSVLRTLKDANVSFSTLIGNLQESIDRERAAQNEAIRLEGDLGPRATFQRYMTYPEIVNNIRDLEKRHPDRVKSFVIGRTFEGRDIIAVRLSSSFGPEVRSVLVDAGMHAREWIAPATAVYLINEIAENNDAAKELLFNLDWYIIPVLNPDGYEYTYADPKQRLWRKNKNRTGNERCYGVDINRNFGYHWNEIGGSPQPCDDTYIGPKRFSEAETAGIRDFILDNSFRLKMYLSLHSHGFHLTYPWAFTSSLPADWQDLHRIAEEANKVMVQAGSRKPYTIGTTANIIEPASGVSIDWVKREVGVQKSFLLSLPGGGSSGFDLPPAEIDGVVKQLFQGFRVFANHARITT